MKKIVSLILVIIILFNTSSTLVQAVEERIIDELSNNTDTENTIRLEENFSEEKIYENYKYKICNDEYIVITKYIGNDYEISIPNTIEGYRVQEIGDCAFSNCIELKEIEIPESVTKIGNSAFDNCTSLTILKIPDAVTHIGYYCFKNCENLETINYPINLERIAAELGAEGRIFEGCKKLTRIEVPEGVTKIVDYAFNNSNLEEIKLPSTLQEIGDFAFSYCVKLKQIQISDNIKKIGYDAFYGCTELEALVQNLYSKTTINLIDDNIKDLRFHSDVRKEKSFMLDDNKCSYTTNFSSNYNGGSVGVVLNYAIKQDMIDRVSSISIKLPANGELISKSLYIDKDLCQNYEENENSHLITIPISKSEGRITFNLKIIEDGNILSYAILNYNQKWMNSNYDIIGIICNEIETVSIETSSVTNSENIMISGISTASQNVEIYINDSFTTTVKTNKVGSYSTNINLPDIAEGKEYTLKAKITNNKGEEIYATTNTKYSSSIPIMTGFNMIYGQDMYDLLSETIPTVTFVQQAFHGNNDNIMTFEVKFTNPENVTNVYVTSDRNNITKRIKANWDEEKQAFVTSDYFDENNVDYVPGKLNVYYTDINGMTDIIEDIKLNQEIKENIFKDATAELISETETNSEIKITLKDNSEILVESELLNFKEGLIEILGNDAYEVLEYENKEMVTYTLSKTVGDLIVDVLKTGGKIVAKDTWEKVYYQETIETATGEKIVTYVIDTIEKSIEKVTINLGGKCTSTFLYSKINEKTYESVAKEGNLFWSTYYGTYKNFNYFFNTNDELNSIRNSIANSNKSEEEKAILYKKVDNYEMQLAALTIIREVAVVIDAYISYAGLLTFTPQGLVIGAAIFLAKDIMLDLWENNIDIGLACLLGMSSDSSINWAIDPSGYIYEAVTTNRLKGVKCEAYYLDEDTGEEILWNAGEYNQNNPFYTDSWGQYAWDVPEGKWKVTYSLDGYETTSTDWLDVPPPQTDVNISLISYEEPTVEINKIDNDKVIITFSKYMIPETISNIEIKDENDNIISYSLEYNKDGSASDGTTYSKEYTLKVSSRLNDNQKYFITFPETLKSYAGISISENTVLIQTNNSNSKFSISLITSSQTVKPNEEFEVLVKLDKLTDIEDGILVLGAVCKYDENVIELLKIEGMNDWAKPVYNPDNGKFITDSSHFETEGSTICKFIFKAKLLDEETKTNIVLNNIEASNGKYKIRSNDVATNVTIDNYNTGTSTSEYYIKSDRYMINEDKKIITKILPEMTYNQFMENIKTNYSSVIIKDKDGNKISGDNTIGTGMILQVESGKEFTLVVTGDIDGNSKITIVDLARLKLHYVETTLLDDISIIAADIDGDEKISLNDLAKIKLILVDLLKLEY